MKHKKSLSKGSDSSPKKRTSVLGLGIVLSGISIICLSLYLIFIPRPIPMIEEPNPQPSKEVLPATPTITQTGSWPQYTNKEYGYSLLHPRFLLKREYRNEGGYLYFVKFEETEYSVEKGVAVGVSKTVLKDETQRLKKEMTQFLEADLVAETQFNLNGYDAVRLEYVVKNKEVGEDRTIVLVTKGDYVYSLSTVPQQIDQVIISFKFL